MQLHQTIGNVESTNVSTQFFTSSYSFRDMKSLHFLPSKSRSRSRSAIFTITPFHVKCQNLQISIKFLRCPSPFQKYNFFNFCPSKSRSRSCNAISHLHRSIGNVKLYKCLPQILAISSYRFEVIKIPNILL